MFSMCLKISSMSFPTKRSVVEKSGITFEISS